MQVKDLLTEALSRANWIESGFPAEADQLDIAKKYLDSVLRRYSDANMITAYQQQLNFTPTSEEFTVGKPVYKDNVVIHNVDYVEDIPNPATSRYVVGRDFLVTKFETDGKKAMKLELVDGVKTWVPCDEIEFSKFVPDIVCNDMVRICSVMCKNEYNRWMKIDRTAFSEFFCDDRTALYTDKPCGENCVQVNITPRLVNRECKVVYNSSMKLGRNDSINLPESHIELLTLATTVEILIEDQDSDPTQLMNKKEALKELENQIRSNSASTKPIVRGASETYGSSRLDALYSGSFIYR